MPKVETWEKKIAWIVSGALGVTICATALLLLRGNPLFDEYFLLAVVITVFPPAVLDYVDYRWKRSIDKHLPDLFRSIVQAQKSGMTLPQALEEGDDPGREVIRPFRGPSDGPLFRQVHAFHGFLAQFSALSRLLRGARGLRPQGADH